MTDILRPAAAECLCGGDLENEDGVWYHSRIEDFSHVPTPKHAATSCPACGARVEDLDEHIENTPDCLRAVEMGLVDGEEL